MYNIKHQETNEFLLHLQQKLVETPKLEMPTKKLLPGIWRDVGAAFSAKEICCKLHGTRIKPVVHI